MLAKWCYILLLSIKCVVNSEKFFLIHKYDDDEYFCVTNSSFALTWIDSYHPSFNRTPKASPSSEFIPKTSNKHFEIEQGLTVHDRTATALILDRRWEELQVYTTTPALSFVHVNITTPKNFRIPFSLRIEKEAHIFLCDGDNVITSKCYWLLLDVFKEFKTVLRRCEKGEILAIKKVRANVAYQKSVTESVLSGYLSWRVWRHFELLKFQNYLTLHIIQGMFGTTILDWNDPNPIDVTHLFIRSNEVTGLWKFHKTTPDLSANKEGEKIQLNPSMDVVNGSVCINFFLLMCAECKVKLTLQKDNSDTIEQVYTSKTSTYSKDGKPRIILNEWNEIKFTRTNIESQKVSLTIKTIAKNNENTFWVFDKVRQCQKDEFRVIVSNVRYACQLVTDYSTVILNENHQNIGKHSVSNMILNSSTMKQRNQVKSHCSEHGLGHSCIPCFWSPSQNCSRAKICEVSEKVETCSCSAGYTGSDCSQKCPNGLYGHDCARRCNRCLRGSCDKLNGNCVCRDDYSGPECDIKPATVFAEGPTIELIQASEVRIRFRNLKIINGTSDTPSGYTIQYKVKTVGEKLQLWHEHNRIFGFETKDSINIKNLDPGTNYLIRGIVITKSGKKVIDDRIPFTEFSTFCAINQRNLFVEATNTSAKLFVNIKINTLCNVDKFKIHINGTDVQISKTSGNRVYFRNLVPFTFYEIRVDAEATVAKTMFQTSEGIPGEVQHLSSKTVGPTSIALQWKKPVQTRGFPIYYIVRYQLVHHLNCKQILPSLEKTATTTEEFISLNDLTPFSNYSIVVSVNNRKLESKSRLIFATTSGISDRIYDNEIPEIKTVTPKNTSVAITFSHLNCSKILGYSYVDLEAYCSNPWCYNVTTRFPYNSNNNVYTLKNLIPFSNYSLGIKFCRNENICSNKTMTEFQSDASFPPKLSELSVYSRNESSVSLRWKSPYPPMGVLQFFNISYAICKESFIRVKIVSESPCKIWKECYCYTLFNLQKNRRYCFKVQSRNENVDYLSTPTAIDTFTATEPSKAPYDLKLHWLQNNDLEIEWKHPNETNGEITAFRIFLDPQISNNTDNYLMAILSIKPGDYQLLYHYKIEAKKILPSIQYKIRIAPDNGHMGEDLVSDDVFSPPELPVLSKGPFFLATETTIRVEFLSTGNISQVSVCVVKVDSHVYLQDEMILNCLYLCEHTLDKSDNFSLTVGNASVKTCDNETSNPPLLPKTKYNITITLTTAEHNYSRCSVFSNVVETLQHSSYYISELFIYGVVLVTIMINIILGLCALFLYCKRKANQNLVVDCDQSVPLTHSSQMLQLDTFTLKETKIVDIARFGDYVKTKFENDELLRQHRIILQRTSSIPYQTEYNDKLFYKYVGVPFDNFTVPNAYIITAMPQTHDINEFWKLIWRKNVKNIIFIDNGPSNEENSNITYWCPEITLSITIQLLNCQNYRHHSCRKISVTYQNKRREITQFHFSSWLENQMFNSTTVLASFFQKIKCVPLDGNSPILVHSRSSLTVTGCVLLSDICLRTVDTDGYFDVFHTAEKLTECRAELMNDSHYYMLAHLIILRALSFIDTRFDSNLSEDDICQRFHHLTDLLWVDHLARTIKRNTHHTSTLSTYPPNEEHEYVYVDKINPLFVEGLQNEGKFVVAKMPTRHNLQNFWKVVQEHNVTKIVALNEMSVTDENFVWSPNKQCCNLNVAKDLVLSCKEDKVLNGYTWSSVDLENETIEIFSLKIWEPNLDCPSDINTFLNFCVEVYDVLEQSQNTLVTCWCVINIIQVN